jgi:hypothetical protein
MSPPSLRDQLNPHYLQFHRAKPSAALVHLITRGSKKFPKYRQLADPYTLNLKAWYGFNLTIGARTKPALL